MTALEALARTRNRPLLARPIGWRGGYYVGDDGQIYDLDPLELGPDLRTPRVRLARWPSWEALVGEWETVRREP